MSADAPVIAPATTGAGRSDRRLFWVIAAAALLLFVIGSWIPSFWYDEAATLRLARLPLPDLLAFAGHRDAVHVVYALFMHGWIALTGESELLVRLPSAFASALASGGVFVLARRLGGDRGAATLAAALFAFLPRTLLQTGEARSYAIAVALLVAAALLALRASASGRARDWLWYGLVAALAVWCFAYAALVLPALGMLAARGAGDRRRRAVRGLLAAVVPALPAIPLVLLMLGQRGQVAWLETQAVNPYTVIVEPFFGWAAWLAAGAIALLVVGIVRGRLRATGAVLALVIWTLLPAVVLLAAGLVTQPLFTPRYLAVSAPALAVLCGLAVSGLRTRTLLVIGLSWAVAAAPFAVASRTVDAKPGGLDLRAVAAVIHDGAQPGDAFLLGADGTGALRPRTALAAYPAAFAGLRDLALVRPYAETGTYWDEVRRPSAVDLTGTTRVWVATRGDDPFAASLDDAGFRSVRSTTVTGVRVALWERAD